MIRTKYYSSDLNFISHKLSTYVNRLEIVYFKSISNVLFLKQNKMEKSTLTVK